MLVTNTWMFSDHQRLLPISVCSISGLRQALAPVKCPFRLEYSQPAYRQDS
jgi:hypothetical protein